jgi:hypothetical protein
MLQQKILLSSAGHSNIIDGIIHEVTYAHSASSPGNHVQSNRLAYNMTCHHAAPQRQITETWSIGFLRLQKLDLKIGLNKNNSTIAEHSFSCQRTEKNSWTNQRKQHEEN